MTRRDGDAVDGGGNKVFTSQESQEFTRLTDLLSAKHALDADITACVGELRRAGATWQEIGQAVGITRQGACQRWARKLGSRAVQ